MIRHILAIVVLGFGLGFAVPGCNVSDEVDENQEENDDADPDEPSQPTVEITEYPGHDIDEAALVTDGDELEFHFEINDCDSDDCHTECSFGDAGYSACTSPATFDFDAADEGLLPVHVRLFDDSAVVDEDDIVAQLRVDFDFGVDELTDGETTAFVRPIELTPFCDHDDCRIHCQWAGDDIACVTDDPILLEIPDADDATLSVEACAQPDDLDNHCFEVKEYHFDITDAEWKQVSTGEAHTCAILDTDDTLWCWGDNDHGRLGVGESSESHDSAQQVVVDGEPDIEWAQVAAGGAHTCAVTEGEALYCWGRNSDDQLGLGDGANSVVSNPTLVGDDQAWSAVTTGLAHSCAIADGGDLYCWGENRNGQLGVGDTNERTEPTGVDETSEAFFPLEPIPWNTTIIEVSAGDEHTCAVTDDNKAYCWGSLSDGKVGAEIDLNVIPIPQAVDSPTGDEFFSIATGRFHSCAIVNTSAQCWGSSDFGQIGNGETTLRYTPTDVFQSEGFHTITAGAGHSCAIDDNNNAYCWGANEIGQLGNNEYDTYETTPTDVDSDDQYLEISAGGQHTCAISTDHSLYCWGNASNGRLGTATGDDIWQTTPNPIAWPPSL